MGDGLAGAVRRQLLPGGADPGDKLGVVRQVAAKYFLQPQQGVDALLLIGGEAWLDGSNDDVLPLVQRALDQGALVGGICNAATFLAEHGFLDDRARTGNTVEFMRQGAPHYQGAQHFVEAQAVAEGGIITANGSGTLEFAREVLRLLDAKPEEAVESWYRFNKDGLYSA